MLEMMVYWEDEHSKLKTERSLRSRRVKPEEPNITTVSQEIDVDKIVEHLAKQTKLVEQQNERIKMLTEVLERVVINGNGNIKKDVDEEDEELPVLRDNLPADVIDTSKIKVAAGTAGNEISTGEDITDTVEQLKKLRKMRRKE